MFFFVEPMSPEMLYNSFIFFLISHNWCHKFDSKYNMSYHTTRIIYCPPNVTLLHPVIRFGKIYLDVENRQVKIAEVSTVKDLPHTNL